jgi:hypothetical protein
MKLYTAENCTNSYQTRVTRSGKGYVHAIWYPFVKILARGIIFYLMSRFQGKFVFDFSIVGQQNFCQEKHFSSLPPDAKVVLGKSPIKTGFRLKHFFKNY